MRLLIYISLIVIFTGSTALAQVSGSRDCATATILCNKNTIIDTVKTSSTGDVGDIPNGAGVSCITKSERRPFWYQFTAENSGTFEMFLENLSGDQDDWDWAFFDKSNGCGAGNWIELACNSSEDVCSMTGISSTMRTNWTPLCNNFVSNPWHPTLELIEGHTYIIYLHGEDINNMGNSFSLSFGGSVNFKNITSSFIVDMNPSCFGRTINFTNTSTYPSGTNDYKWYFGDGNTATTEHASHNYSAPGTYTVSLVVENGFCKDSSSTIINVIATNFADATAAPASICNGTSTQLNATGGVSYAWLPDATLSDTSVANPVATPTTTTTYTVVATNEIGCIDTAQVTVTVTYIDVSAGNDTTICEGTNFSLNATGGISYLWSPDDGSISDIHIANPTVSPLATTTYTVWVEDAAGCLNSDDITVTVNPLPTAYAGNDVSICNGLSTNLNASGGITYSWTPTGSLSNPNIANPLATPTAPTTYTVLVTDDNGCSNTDQVFVNVTYIPVDAGNDTTICFGNTVMLNGEGGNSYNWTPVETLNNPGIKRPRATPTTTTTYYVEVTDNTGCKNIDSVTVTVTYIPVDAGNDATICLGESTQLQASGGVTFEWSPATGLSDANISNPIATPSVTTTYTVTVTDANECVNTDEVTVYVNTLPTADAGSGGTVCAGESVQLQGAGGGTYSWSPSIGLSDTDIANPVATPTATTTYTLTVTDGNGCSDSDDVTVNINPLPLADAGDDETICNGNSVTLNATGGISYQWLPATGLSATDIPNPVASPTETITYTVIVTDINNCASTDEITVTVDYIPVDAGPDTTVCYGESVQLEATGGTTYDWSPTTGLSDPTVANPVATPTETTTYTVTITDDNGCVNTAQVTVNINPLPIAEANEDMAICNGISYQLNATGGVSYLWSPAESLDDATISNPVATPNISTTYTVTVTDANGCSSSDITDITVTYIIVDAGNDATICENDTVQLEATGGISYEWSPDNGSLSDVTIANPTAFPTSTTTYTVIVTDVNGCINSDSVTINVNTLPVADAGPDQSICNGVSAQLEATGGGSYMWSPSATLDNDDIANPIATPNTTTVYTVTVTDANGCFSSDDVEVEVTYITVSAGPDTTMCYGESVQLEATGGTTYEWSPTTGLSDPTVANPVATPTETTTYTVIITDDNGCVNTAQVTVNVNPLPNAEANGDMTICNGLSYQLNATGGVSYLWSPAESLDDASISNPVATPNISTTYTVIVTDANGCSSSDITDITVTYIIVDAGNDATICENDTVQLEATGGISYEWSPDNGSLSDVTIANPTAFPTSTTTYTVIVTDVNGCINSDSVTINVNTLPVADAGPDQSICNGVSAQLEATGGGSYMWSPTATLNSDDIANPVATPNATTVYTVTVTDANGCFSTDEVEVEVTYITVSAGDDVTICNGVSAQLQATGGTIYEWSPTAGLSDPTIANPVATPTETTTYTVTITDDNGCVNTDEVVVNVNYIDVDAGSDVTICNGVFTQLNATGGDIYEWSPATGLSDANIANPVASPNDTITYIVTITDENGCINIDSVTVNVTYITVDAGEDQSTCEGAPVQLTATGGETYEWSPAIAISNPNISDPFVSPSDTTTYYVTVTDENGCINIDSVTVNTIALPIATASADETSICNGLTTQLHATGGLTYLWSPSATLDDAESQSPIAMPNTTTTYVVTVTDANGCSNTDSVEIEVTYISIGVGTHPDICSGTTATLTATGGEQYMWSPGNLEGQTITVNPVDTTTYYVTVTDINGCFNTDSVTVNTIPLPTGYATATPSEICLGQTVLVSAFFDAGFTPKSPAYSFNGGNSFRPVNFFPTPSINSDTIISIVLADINGCLSEPIPLSITIKTLDATITQTDSIPCFGMSNAAVEIELDGGNTGFYFSYDGIIFSPNNRFDNIPAGNHIIVVEDANTCRYNVPFTITQPDSLEIVVASLDNVNPCAGNNNGSIEIDANGGTPAYQYSFNGSAYSSNTLFEGLGPGNYTVSVRDQKGCLDSRVLSIVEPAPVNVADIEYTKEDNECIGYRDGSITLIESTIQGGVPDYTFTLNGVTQTKTKFDSIPAGQHTLIITDANGCEFYLDFSIGPEGMSFLPVISEETCENKDGSITITNPSGGTPGYTFSLDGSTFGTNNSFTGLGSGDYEPFIRDTMGCKYGLPVKLSKKPGPDTHVTLTDITCHKYTDGMVRIDSVTGGVPNIDASGLAYYEFSIDNGFTWHLDTLLTGLPAGKHTLMIRDGECVYRDQHPYYVFNEEKQEMDTIYHPYFFLNQPDTLEALAFGIPGVKQMSNGSIGIYEIKGGTSPYFFSADNSNFNLVESDTVYLTGYDRGYNTVYVKDNYGCPIAIKAFVDVPMFIPNLITPNNDGKNDRFEIVSLPINSELRVFNRWGNMVYKHPNYDNSWDGGDVPDGVYYYDLVLPDKQLIKGWIDVKR